MATALGFFLLLAQAADILVKGHATEVLRSDGLELFRFDEARSYLVISVTERDGRFDSLEGGAEVIDGATLVAVWQLFVLAFRLAFFAELDLVS